MAYITGSVFDSLGILPFSLAAGTQLTMSIQNNSNAPSYYGLETIPNNNGFYTAATPKNTSGSYISGSGISYITYDDYKMVAVVNPGGGTLVYTPSVAVSASTVWTKGTGASLLPADFGTLLPGSYNQRVVNSGGYVESPDSITAAIAATPILKDASFLYIPSGYSSGTAFSELSTNDYGDLTWSRASDGFRTNSEGLVQRVPWNLVQYSEDFSNAAWTKSATTLTANTTVAPNNTTTADTLIENTANSTHQIFQSITNVNGVTPYTAMIYVKENASRNVAIRIQDGAFTYGQVIVTYNLNTGALISQVTTGNGVIVSTSATLTNGYYLITVSFSLNLSTSFRYDVLMVNGTSNSYMGDGISSIVIWGAQLVEGTSAQSYLTTTTRLNVPRLDYTYGTSPASLLEPQRTNVALYSDDFTDVNWTKTNTTITANTTTSPDGTINADKIVETATNASHFVVQNISTTLGVTYNISFYGKASERGVIQWNNQVNTDFVNFDLVNGVVGSSTGVTNQQIQSVDNGWYRCSFNYVSTSTSITGWLRLCIVTSASASRLESYLGNGTNGLFLWGCQFEVGAYPTTYIPTTSATVTRLVDAFSRNNIYTNGMITSTGGTWFAELRNNVAYVRDAGGFFGLLTSSTLSTNGFVIKTASGTSQRLFIGKRIADVESLLYTTLTDTIKVAIKWNGTTADVFVNGTKQVTATLFTATIMEFLNGNGSDVPKYIQQMALYSQPLAGVDMGVLTGASYYPSFLNMAQALNYTIA
jgi:hypothetical protein